MSNELVVISPRSLEEAEKLSGTLAKAQTLPDALRQKPADVLAIVLTGAELGLAPMQAIRALAIIKGKPTLAADAMGALVKRRKDICEYLVCEHSDATKAVFVTKRAGDPKPTPLTFTIEQAKLANLTGGDNWRKYPDAMLRARALSALCRLVYPDLLLGVYDPDELEPNAGPPPTLLEKDITPPKEATGKRESKALAAKVSKVVDVQPGESEAEAIARTAEGMTETLKPDERPSPGQRVRAAIKARGITEEQMKARLKAILGTKSLTDLSHEDVDLEESSWRATRPSEPELPL